METSVSQEGWIPPHMAAHHARLEKARHDACWLNQAIVQHGLVVMHSGNASVYDAQSGQMLIKPSGVDYDQMTPDLMVQVDVRSGAVIGDSLRPSVDLPHHLMLYRNMPGVASVVHTHSTYATAFAACLQPIPMCLTAIADEFGGEIPCAPYVDNADDNIGRTILRHHTHAPAILLGNHGVFAWGATAAEALKAAVMVEDVARTVSVAKQIGQPVLLPVSEAAKWHNRYQTRYGQIRSAA